MEGMNFHSINGKINENNDNADWEPKRNGRADHSEAGVVSRCIDALERLAGVEVKTHAFAYLGTRSQEGGVSANRR